MNENHQITNGITYEGPAYYCLCRWSIGPYQHHLGLGPVIHSIARHHASFPRIDHATELPLDIANILDSLVRWADGYGGNLKWNEEEKLKSDLMLNRSYWMKAPARLILGHLVEAGLNSDDCTTIIDYVTRAQAGRRLQPKSYKGFSWNHEGPQEKTTGQS